MEGGGGVATAKTRTMTMMDSNYIDIKITLYDIIYLFFCTSCSAMEATQRHANPWNINMIIMD
jgi:hypothetical protein